MTAPDVATYRVVDLFAGPGGWDEGAAAIGLEGIHGFDIDPDACATAEAAGHHRTCTDIADLDPNDYQGATGLIASPPCPDWSTAGNGEQGSKHLTYLVGDWIAALEPEWVALEQVPAALVAWQALLVTLWGADYNGWTGVLNAADYGVPQTRKRAILIASRRGPVGPPRATHHQHANLLGLPEWVSTADALWVSPAAKIDRRNTQVTVTGEREPVALVSCDRPAPTVTGQAVGQWLIDGDNLTIHDAATLQGFRPDYPWQGTKGSKGQQIGNAVPPPLAAAVLAEASGIADHHND